MNLEKAKLLIIEVLNEPPGTQVDFLLAKQKESNYSPNGFMTLLISAVQYWLKVIDEINADTLARVIKGAVPNSVKISLFTYTNGAYHGHLGYSDIKPLTEILNDLMSRNSGTIKGKDNPPPDICKKPVVELHIEYLKSINKIIQKPTILEMKNMLNEYFINCKNKFYFIEYLEFDFLPKRKIKIKIDAAKFSDAKMPLIKGMMYYAEDKTKYLEEWIQEKRPEIILPPQQIAKQGDGHTQPPTINKNPTIETEQADKLFGIIKVFFEPEQHTELKTLFETGIPVKQKLVFKSKANRLTDTFKQLIEYNLLTGCEKKDLAKWLINNFQFIKKGKPADLNPATTHKSISGNQYHCKNQLIKIEAGHIQRFE